MPTRILGTALGLLFILLATWWISSPQPVHGDSVCAGQTLDQYLAGSCTIGNLRFSNFTFASTGSSGLAIPATSVTVAPITTLHNEGLGFFANWNVASAGGTSNFQDNVIKFTVTTVDGTSSLTDAHLLFDGAFTGTGFSSASTAYCFDHLLPGCSPSVLKANTVSNPPGIFSDGINYTGAQTVDSSTEINVTSGTSGTAVIGQTTTTFSSTGLLTALPPTISKSFDPATIALGGKTTLTFTITNPNNIPLTGVGFTDQFPSGIHHTTTVRTGSCGSGGGISNQGGTDVFANAVTLAANETCTFSWVLESTSVGVKQNVTSPITSVQSGPGGTATATVTVIAPLPPTISKSFDPPIVQLNGKTTLTFTITNPNNVPLTGVAFTDQFPSGIHHTTTVRTGSCGSGGGISNQGGTDVFANAVTLAANETCTFSWVLEGTSPGLKLNVTEPITSKETGPGGSASASLLVVDPNACIKVCPSVPTTPPNPPPPPPPPPQIPNPKGAP